MVVFKLLSFAMAFGLLVGSAHADAIHRNPYQPANAPNMKTFGRTSIPIGAYEYCGRYPGRCKFRTKKRELYLNRQAWKKIVDINLNVNQSVMPMTDQDNYGVVERWEIPVRVGDCEDYVLAKMINLSKAGIPLGAMRVTVVYDEQDGGHAVLTIVTDKGDFILDNNNNKVLRWQKAELTYLKRNTPGNLMRWESLRPEG